MPYLELPRVELQSRTSLAYVESIMTYPDPKDQELRDRLFAAAELQFTKDMAALDSKLSAMRGRPEVGVSSTEFVQYSETQDSVPDIESIRKEAREENRYTYGMLVGVGLNHLLAAEEKGEPATSRSDVLDDLLNFDPALGRTELGVLLRHHKINKTYANQQWPTYSRVAHLYSARFALSKESVEGSFPCRADALPTLLEFAERDLKLAQGLKYKNGKAVLDAKKAWIVRSADG